MIGIRVLDLFQDHHFKYQLMVSTDAKNVAQGASLNMSSNRFRPNLVVAGAEPYAEDTWKNLRIGGKFFTVSFWHIHQNKCPFILRWTAIRFIFAVIVSSLQSLGGCNRCQVINLINEGGRILKSNEPLATLASYRRMKVWHIIKSSSSIF